MADYGPFFLVCIFILVVLTIFCLIRAILGPKLADRIMAVNMIGTMTIAMIVLLAAWMDEVSFLDIALIYAVISFISVIVLAKIYVGIYRERKSQIGDIPRETDSLQKEETT